MVRVDTVLSSLLVLVVCMWIWTSKCQQADVNEHPADDPSSRSALGRVKPQSSRPETPRAAAHKSGQKKLGGQKRSKGVSSKNSTGKHGPRGITQSPSGIMVDKVPDYICPLWSVVELRQIPKYLGVGIRISDRLFLVHCLTLFGGVRYIEFNPENEITGDLGLDELGNKRVFGDRKFLYNLAIKDDHIDGSQMNLLEWTIKEQKLPTFTKSIRYETNISAELVNCELYRFIHNLSSEKEELVNHLDLITPRNWTLRFARFKIFNMTCGPKSSDKCEFEHHWEKVEQGFDYGSPIICNGVLGYFMTGFGSAIRAGPMINFGENQRNMTSSS